MPVTIHLESIEAEASAWRIWEPEKEGGVPKVGQWFISGGPVKNYETDAYTQYMILRRCLSTPSAAGGVDASMYQNKGWETHGLNTKPALWFPLGMTLGEDLIKALKVGS